MRTDPLPSPADACAPDPDRAGTDASARIPEWLVHLLALIIRFILEHSAAARARRAGVPVWLTQRHDLPPGSFQQIAAALRGEFGNAIVSMCRRRGYGPGDKDWPYLARMIVTFGGSIDGFRPGLPALGLVWYENPHIMPGMIGAIPATPGADAVAELLEQAAAADAPAPLPQGVGSDAMPALPPARPRRREALARTSTGPPIGPPARRLPLSCLTHGASHWLAPPSGFVRHASHGQA